MRELLVREFQQVNGGSVLSDISSVFTEGLASRDVTVGVMGLSIGVMLGGVVKSTFAPWVAVGILASWTLLEMGLNSQNNA